jgi:hypothetical protein
MEKIMKHTQTTGARISIARAGYTDATDFGEGFVAGCFGNLDAPDYWPQGSMVAHDGLFTGTRYARQSIGQRDFPDHASGTLHDGVNGPWFLS